YHVRIGRRDVVPGPIRLGEAGVGLGVEELDELLEVGDREGEAAAHAGQYNDAILEAVPRPPRSYGRFFAGVVTIDLVAVLAFGVILSHPARVEPKPQQPPPGPPASSAASSVAHKPADRPDAGPKPAPKIWGGVDPAELGKRVGALYLSVRKNL